MKLFVNLLLKSAAYIKVTTPFKYKVTKNYVYYHAWFNKDCELLRSKCMAVKNSWSINSAPDRTYLLYNTKKVLKRKKIYSLHKEKLF